MSSSRICFLPALALLTLFAAPAWAQTRIISGFPPGGGVDSLARIFPSGWPRRWDGPWWWRRAPARQA